MLINRIESNFVDRFGRVMRRITTYGKYNGTSIAIDNLEYKGKTFAKHFVAWTDDWQLIRNKVRNKDGRFERVC